MCERPCAQTAQMNWYPAYVCAHPRAGEHRKTCAICASALDANLAAAGNWRRRPSAEAPQRLGAVRSSKRLRLGTLLGLEIPRFKHDTGCSTMRTGLVRHCCSQHSGGGEGAVR